MSGRRGGVGGRGYRGSSSSRGRGRNQGGSGGTNSATPRRNGAGNRGRGRSSATSTPKRNERSQSSAMRDEDVLIAFMPYLKSANQDAAKIYEHYQTQNDQNLFLSRAREFLDRVSENNNSESSRPHTSPSADNTAKSATPPQFSVRDRGGSFLDAVRNQQGQGSVETNPSTSQNGVPSVPPASPPHVPSNNNAMSFPQSSLFPASLPSNPPPITNTTRQQELTRPQQHPEFEDRVFGMSLVEQSLNNLFSANNDAHPENHANNGELLMMNVSNLWGAAAAPAPPRQQQTPAPIGVRPAVLEHPLASNLPASSSGPPVGLTLTQNPPGIAPSPPALSTQSTPNRSLDDAASSKTEKSQPSPALLPPKREAPPPKRLWTHFEEQPGRITVQGVNGQDASIVLPLGPREELTANWSLPIRYLQSKRKGNSLEQALDGLTIGLFRRGCTENGTQASIISKSVLGDEKRSYEYWYDGNAICGRVPFFSPRTPGYVVFRMYADDEPIYTLAVGPSLHVRVLENDFDPSIRFILSNFKGKKSNPTSLSSLHSLAVVLETQLSHANESAARATWGCIQEARKVIDACFAEYTKTTKKMAQLEETVDELKKQVDEEQETKSQTLSLVSDDQIIEDQQSTEGGTPESEQSRELKEKTKLLLSGRASCERKWRDSQLAFASILRSVVTNQTMSILLRRELISRMRIELELWCPLSEEFACPEPGTSGGKLWYEPMRDLPHPITADEFAAYGQARIKMQMRTLNFEPNTNSLEDILFPRNRGSPNERAMDPGAVAVFNTMSAAMGNYYHTLFANEDEIVRRREVIRQRIEQLVHSSGEFPAKSRVVIFGSSANGFGSPNSDIDMCLQLPEGMTLREEDTSGAAAMANLAIKLEEDGMKSVDTCRLTARIPILMFQCPDPLSKDEEDFIECDLSMQNPLAVLNTSYLRCYAEVTPITRVLASVIKRWAKSRDINTPARHTLSSYGYILMLLHFLTYHERSGNGLLSKVSPVDGNPDIRNQRAPQPTPILPNFHWMDPRWPSLPNGTPYVEMPSLPRNMIKHPLVEGKVVNTYFCRPSSPESKKALQVQFSGQDLSLGILLASFFRYYAFEFDYKRHVVSLHSTASRGVVEREVKAELDGWRNYSAALTIEDPFETFYDVAHVLRGGYYHRIRREFAVAYSKIADAASGRPGSWNKGDLRKLTGPEIIDWLCEPVANEREQQAP